MLTYRIQEYPGEETPFYVQYFSPIALGRFDTYEEAKAFLKTYLKEQGHELRDKEDPEDGRRHRKEEPADRQTDMPRKEETLETTDCSFDVLHEE